MLGVTSSIGHTDTVDIVKGIPLFSAALAACTSPRRAYMPVKPTGAKIKGRSNFSPNSSALKSKSDISFKTRCLKATSDKSCTFLFSVCSLYEPPSI